MAQFDVREFKHVEIISELIKKSGLKISLMDFNNIWMSGYTQEGDSYQKMVKQFSMLGHKNSLLLAMTFF